MLGSFFGYDVLVEKTIKASSRDRILFMPVLIFKDIDCQKGFVLGGTLYSDRGKNQRHVCF